jgi:sulfur carrier protein
MQIQVNGESRTLAEGSTIADLLAELGLSSQGVAVEVNRDVVPRGRHAEHTLVEGDEVEVVRAIGGGAR